MKGYQPQGRYFPKYRYSETAWLREDRRRQEELHAAAEARSFVGPMLNPREHFAGLDLTEVCTNPAHPRFDEVLLYIEQYTVHNRKEAE